jgi:hypothetical protein
MTTGRINQVTILTPRPEGVGEPPPERGRVLHESGLNRLAHAGGVPSRRARIRYKAKITCTRSLRLRRVRATYPFAPTEFPAARSTARCQPEGFQGVICARQEEDSVRQTCPKARTGFRFPPSVLFLSRTGLPIGQ